MTFADLKMQHPVAEVISRYVALRPKGSYLIGRCPFHEDGGRPNMAVFPRTNTFKCFACGVMGDALDFVSRIENIGTAKAARRIEQMQGTSRQLIVWTGGERADAAYLDRVYRALLDELSLSGEHRAALARRGLSPKAIQEGGYRSLPVAGRWPVIDRLERRGLDLSGVPGFARSRTGQGWNLYGRAGLLVPVRDLQGRILGCQVRADADDAGPRYRWLSTPDTENRVGGASSGAPCHVAGRKLVRRRWAVWVTEGPLKAEVASHLLSVPMLGVAGVANWRKALPVIQVLEVQRVILAFDQDESAKTRQAVERNLADFRETLESMGSQVLVASWGRGKGVDDALQMKQWISVR